MAIGRVGCAWSKCVSVGPHVLGGAYYCPMHYRWMRQALSAVMRFGLPHAVAMRWFARELPRVCEHASRIDICEKCRKKAG